MDWISPQGISAVRRGFVSRVGRLSVPFCEVRMAERVGFEPTVGVNLHTLSKRAP